MRTFNECNKIPESAPTLEKCEKSKSKKVIKLKDEWFFITKKGVGSTLYSIRLGVQLAYFPHQDMDSIFKFILEKMETIKGLNFDFE